jgi:hypothetical protein
MNEIDATLFPCFALDFPERLHYYTTLEGLEGMLSSGLLWASYVAYTNDAPEMTYSYDLRPNLQRPTGCWLVRRCSPYPLKHQRRPIRNDPHRFTNRIGTSDPEQERVSPSTLHVCVRAVWGIRRIPAWRIVCGHPTVVVTVGHGKPPG